MSPRAAARRFIGRARLIDLPIEPLTFLEMRRVLVLQVPLDALEAFTTQIGSTTVVVLARGRTEEQHRWAAAHELGHLELGHAAKTGARWDCRHGRALCHEANLFAAELLMPRHLVWQAWLKYSGDLDKLARLFGVTVLIMKERADELVGMRPSPFDTTWVSIH